MPPNITRVRWSAGELPWGIDFNENTGTFSGTPDEPGEYVVPVQVQTNYGISPVENVNIIVEGVSYPVYAIGANALTWSNGASPDAQGFYPISIPPAYKLLEHSGGFGAKANGGAYYFCGVKEFKNSQSGEISSVLSSASTPERMTVNGENVDEVRVVSMKDYTYTVRSTNPYKIDDWNYQGYCMLIRYGYNKLRALGSNVRLHYNYEISGVSKTEWDISGFQAGQAIGNSLYKLAEAYTPLTHLVSGAYMLGNRGSELWRVYYSKNDHVWYLAKKETLDFNAIKLFQPYEQEKNGSCSAHKPLFSYLSENRYLDNDPANFTIGTIKDAWVYMTKAYVQTENNSVYEKQGTGSWNNIGYFDVKKILMPSTAILFLLTKDGRLFHKGSGISGITDAHTSITQIFTDCNIHDFTYDSKTLTVIKE